MKNVIKNNKNTNNKKIAKSVSIPLGLTSAAPAADAGIHKKT